MKSLFITVFVLSLLLIASCSEKIEPQPIIQTDLQEITSVTENGLKVTLFASEDLYVGYNTINANIEDADGNLVSGNIQVTPMMDMMTMSHSSPIEFPDGSSLENGSFDFNVVFVMPSGDMGSWRLNFTINDIEVTVPVEVKAPELPRLVSFMSVLPDSTKYFVTFIDPAMPQVGQNDLEIAVFKKKTMMEWPAVTGMEFEMEPWMVSMDHGSPNNSAPIHTENGHYKGIVNFTMTGDWQIRLTMKDNGEVCGKPYFDLYFQ